MSMDRLASWNGCELIADTSARTGKTYYAFIAQEDTVVATLTGGTSGVTSTNFLTSIGLASKTIKQGALIVVPAGNFITNLTLTSGSVIAYS
jgi:hypothetical protein